MLESVCNDFYKPLLNLLDKRYSSKKYSIITPQELDNEAMINLNKYMNDNNYISIKK